MYITMKFIRKRIGEQVEYINNILYQDTPIKGSARRSELIESAQVVQKRFEHYRDLCKGKLGIEIEDVDMLTRSGRMEAGKDMPNLQQIPRSVMDSILAPPFPESHTITSTPPHIK
jgi:hypothetical protein